ncbi:Nif3-like dinuclear metal center hexameric protein [Rubripirellula reticaptiva]|uniref:GTP cyclohydrolase 1 type 2 homolog n=1 Tax=Rubripirellula reticaptiva TaxID=2528013 RepID=A0A5C6EME7_9BACT|nr:Nif3-like dinuclear metal center hexameric protein [Rubripirellula reticaptiva]TWU49524.1 GTP cyclohydrolase 1 type 2 [Rubripirellula reticaptiva]
MATLDAVCTIMARVAPLRLAESWDNVGLLAGDRAAKVEKIMACLTITPDVVDEAIAQNADLIVVHHPLPFKPMAKITTDSIPGAMLWKLIGAKIAIYSAHTAFDSATGGVNQMWAEALGLDRIRPLVELPIAAGTKQVGSSIVAVSSGQTVEGSGRYGRLPSPVTLESLASMAGEVSGGPRPRLVGAADQSVQAVAFACGSGGSFLAAAKRRGCHALVTGEATFHTCLEARSMGIGLVLLGHFHSERFAMERLSEALAAELPDLTVWASRDECDPLQQAD